LSKAKIFSGICGFETQVEAFMDGTNCLLSIDSECKKIKELALELKKVEPLQEISFRSNNPKILELAAKHCPHTACPVPVGIIKAVEVEAGLALPADVVIEITKD